MLRQIGKIAAASAQTMRKSAAHLVHAHRHLLQSGTGCSHHTDGSLANFIGKAQSNAVDNGGTTVRAHHQQAFRLGLFLQCDFIFERDVITVQENMLT